MNRIGSSDTKKVMSQITLKARLKSIRSEIHNYSSMMSATDKVPSVDFEPALNACVLRIKELSGKLPEEFRVNEAKLIELLAQDSYHFGWSETESRITKLIDYLSE